MRITIPKNTNVAKAGKIIADSLRASGYAYPTDILEIALRFVRHEDTVMDRSAVADSDK